MLILLFQRVGLKGPKLGMVEELATVLGAANRSKPVSDLGWRPHGEHVGQTGKPVATNLYRNFGAIQIAGINSSKVKVVINSDPKHLFLKWLIMELYDALKLFLN
jgi:electron transfer flavoprotein alpha subunit